MNMVSLVMTSGSINGDVPFIAMVYPPLKSIKATVSRRFCEPAIFVSAVDTPKSPNSELYRALWLWHYDVGSAPPTQDARRHHQDFYMFSLVKEPGLNLHFLLLLVLLVGGV